MRIRSAVLMMLTLACVVSSVSAAATSADRRAQDLLRSAEAHIAAGTPDQRRFARGLLEDAHLMSPADADIAHALARLYLEAGMLFAARRLAEASIALDREDAEAHFLLGETWRREWLFRGEDVARDQAIASLAHGLRLAPADFARARTLVPLLEDAREREDALEVAKLAARARPDDPESALLVAYAAQHAGDVTLADQLFRRALPRLSPVQRARYEDLSPLLWPGDAMRYDEMTAAERERFNERFWRDTDPDPTTEEHEGQIEFWARVTHSWLLYGVNEMGVWDMRAQLYIRFGPPRWAERNPMYNPVAAQLGAWMAWTYPDLGLRVWMQARNPQGHYGAPFSIYERAAVRAYPESLRTHPEFQGVQGGYAVFRRMPLEVEPMPVGTAIVRLAGTSGALLLGHAEVESPPDRRLRAYWVLMDTASTVLERTTSDVGASACEPASLRAASFATGVAPGRYRLTVRVDDEAGRRAVTARDVVIPPARLALALSDLSVVCGTSATSIVPGVGVRLEPDTGLHPQESDEVLAYFEIYHLQAREDGAHEYDYVCTVSPVNSDRRSWLARAITPRPLADPIIVSRQERTASDMRRQFFSVPVKSLPPGRYNMQVSVTDLVSGARTATLAEFVRH